MAFSPFRLADYDTPGLDPDLAQLERHGKRRQARPGVEVPHDPADQEPGQRDPGNAEPLGSNRQRCLPLSRQKDQAPRHAKPGATPDDRDCAWIQFEPQSAESPVSGEERPEVLLADDEALDAETRDPQGLDLARHHET